MSSDLDQIITSFSKRISLLERANTKPRSLHHYAQAREVGGKTRRNDLWHPNYKMKVIWQYFLDKNYWNNSYHEERHGWTLSNIVHLFENIDKVCNYTLHDIVQSLFFDDIEKAYEMVIADDNWFKIMEKIYQFFKFIYICVVSYDIFEGSYDLVLKIASAIQKNPEAREIIYEMYKILDKYFLKESDKSKFKHEMEDYIQLTLHIHID